MNEKRVLFRKIDDIYQKENGHGGYHGLFSPDLPARIGSEIMKVMYEIRNNNNTLNNIKKLRDLLSCEYEKETYERIKIPIKNPKQKKRYTHKMTGTVKCIPTKVSKNIVKKLDEFLNNVIDKEELFKKDLIHKLQFEKVDWNNIIRTAKKAKMYQNMIS